MAGQAPAEKAASWWLGEPVGSLCSNCIRSLEMQPALPAPQVASPQGPVAIFVLVFSLSHIMTPSGSVFLIFQKTHSNRISLFLAASSITMNKEWKPTRMLTNGKCVPAGEAIMSACAKEKLHTVTKFLKVLTFCSL